MDEGPITRLLRRRADGDADADAALARLVYGELHALAEQHLRRERAGHTLTPTDLIFGHVERVIDCHYMADVVGEVVNIISGSACRVFGHEFAISVPAIIHGAPEREQIENGERAFVIPITWRQYRAALVVSLR